MTKRVNTQLGLEHLQWDHGALALSVLPSDKEQGQDAAAAKEADDDGGIPRVPRAAPLESEQDEDHGGTEQYEAEKVELLGEPEKGSRRFRPRGFEGHQDEEAGRDGADWKVDPEAWTW
jgi:hypothetical protein